MKTLSKLSILSASWVLFSASAVYADMILAVDMSNVTFQAAAGNNSCSGAPCTETFNITFQWDNTTTTLVPGTLSVVATGALSASLVAGPWQTITESYNVGGPPLKLGVAINTATDTLTIGDTDFIFPLVPGVYPYSDALFSCDTGGQCDSLLDYVSGGLDHPPSSISGTVTISATCSPTEVCAVTPLPTALPLFATGLGALGLLGWRRKRKAQAVA